MISNAELSRAGHGVSGNTPLSHGVGSSVLLGEFRVVVDSQVL